MKSFKLLSVVIFLLVSRSVFSQSDKNIILYSCIKDDKGKAEVNNFDGNSNLSFLGSDDKYTFMYSIVSTYYKGSNIVLYSFDKNTMKLNKTGPINLDKADANALIQSIFFFHKKIFVLSAISDKKKYETSFFIQELNGETFEFNKAPVKIFSGGEKVTAADFGIKTAIGAPMPTFAYCAPSYDEENDKMFLSCGSLKKAEEPQKSISLQIDDDGNILNKNEFTLKEAAGKIEGSGGGAANSKGRSYFKVSFTDPLTSKTYYKYFIYDINNPDQNQEFDIDNKGYTLSPVKTFIVNDSLVYDISTIEIDKKEEHGIVNKINVKGLFIGVYSLNTGKAVNEATFNLDDKDFSDLKGQNSNFKKDEFYLSKGSALVAANGQLRFNNDDELYIRFYFCYNKFSQRMYAVYEPVNYVGKGQFVYLAGGDLKVKEFNLSLEQTASFTFKRSKGEGGVIPICTEEGTYLITDSREKNVDYENEDNFKVSNEWPEYYILKIKDEKLSAYGYALKGSFDGLWTDLSPDFIDITGNEKLFYSQVKTKGQFSFVKIKFQ